MENLDIAGLLIRGQEIIDQRKQVIERKKKEIKQVVNMILSQVGVEDISAAEHQFPTPNGVWIVALDQDKPGLRKYATKARYYKNHPSDLGAIYFSYQTMKYTSDEDVELLRQDLNAFAQGMVRMCPHLLDRFSKILQAARA